MSYNMANTLHWYQLQGYKVPPQNFIKTPRQIECIKDSCKLNIALLDYITEQIADGITTGDIDRLIYEKTIKNGGIPATLGYNGFPKSVCVSVNNEVCHGIPDDKRTLQKGDIFNVDVSTPYIFFGHS